MRLCAHEPFRVLARLGEQVIPERCSISREKGNEVERALLWFAERIERPARCRDLLHDLGVLFFCGGDETPLETIQPPQQVGA